MNNAILQPEEHVLSTLEADGSRRWLKPKLSKGKLLARRRLLSWLLIIVFTVVPFIKIAGKPLILLDIIARRFTIFGFTFLPTDTVLLAIFMVGLLLSIFLLTALFGRIWCGWTCPQTVYMEFVFRPIERFFDGTVGRGGHKKNVPVWRTIAKYLVYFLICVYLANTFLAYFVGVDRLLQWVQQSPWVHPTPFLVMASVTFAMMVDFCFFREQMCLVACPYGRFQSVLLDQNSLIVAYDETRGEPRGKIRKNKTAPDSQGNNALPVVGDCINCGNCVTTCPTGIDIRQGLQMECINCTQCIDACNLVMEKIGREPDLIRYSSQARDMGAKGSLLRARTMIYPMLLLGIAVAFFGTFLAAKSFDAVVLRERGNPHTITEDDRVRNLMRLKLTNRTDETMTFSVAAIEPKQIQFVLQEASMELEANATRTFHLSVLADRDELQMGRATLNFRVANELDESRVLTFRLIGPYN
ncbi:MAG: cytochrome c oxidase accessory protein CcoG [Planctomycetota bacterium]